MVIVEEMFFDVESWSLCSRFVGVEVGLSFFVRKFLLGKQIFQFLGRFE
jgi:hypothetical protein